MSLFDREISPQTYALVRFGTGFPGRGSPVEAAGMLEQLDGPDRMAELWPVVSFDAARGAGASLRQAMKDSRKKLMGGAETVREWRVWIRASFQENFVTEMIRWAETDDPFRERLHGFWANHFTARSRSMLLYAAGSGYAEDAIRPHLAGPFAEMLKAAVTHPFMLSYLDQAASIGPNSPRGKATGNGLNENLAREVLELHTLGVGAGYSQADVTEFAELLTGLSFNIRKGAAFRPGMAEPGAETVLRVSYGGGEASLADIHAALDDLARHPATAAHLSRKLAAHFVADDPDPGLVAHMTEAWIATDGHLGAVYAAMLEHPAAWAGFGAKVKLPVEYMASSLRAIGMRAADWREVHPNWVRKSLMGSLRLMGQDYQKPPGPDGWRDDAAAWVHPHGLAARIAWAMHLAARAPGDPPDPRLFVREALGDAASDKLVWAAGVAESRAEGVGVILASAEFNRR